MCIKMGVHIQQAKEEDLPQLVQLALELWPEESEEELNTDFPELFRSSNHTFFLATIMEQPIGFIMASIRSDYVEGAAYSPTGYIEGIYVRAAYRRQAIAKLLVQAATPWMINKGCRQIGSDTSVENTVSRAFHRSLGFTEESVQAHFLMNLIPVDQ